MRDKGNVAKVFKSLECNQSITNAVLLIINY
jgi:hypothetical protein